MALMDKMKAQASQLAQKAQEAGKAGQSKIEEVQAKRAADEVLRQLGLVVFLEQAGRGDGTTEASIARHVETLKEYEAEFGELGPTDSSGGAG